MKLAHFALWTKDLEAAAAFWSQYFQAEVGPRYDSRNRPGFASRFVTLHGLQIELMQGPWVAPAAPEACGWAHLALALGSRADVDAAAARFDAAGLLVSGPRVTGDGYYECVIRSPDGVLIELVE